MQALPIQIINGVDVNVIRSKPVHAPGDNTQNGIFLPVRNYFSTAAPLQLLEIWKKWEDQLYGGTTKQIGQKAWIKRAATSKFV